MVREPRHAGELYHGATKKPLLDRAMPVIPWDRFLVWEAPTAPFPVNPLRGVLRPAGDRARSRRWGRASKRAVPSLSHSVLYSRPKGVRACRAASGSTRPAYIGSVLYRVLRYGCGDPASTDKRNTRDARSRTATPSSRQRDAFQHQLIAARLAARLTQSELAVRIGTT